MITSENVVFMAQFVGNKRNRLKAGVSRKQSTPNFP